MNHLYFVSYLEHDGSNAVGDIWTPKNTYINQHPLLWHKSKKAGVGEVRIVFFYEVPQEIAELL